MQYMLLKKLRGKESTKTEDMTGGKRVKAISGSYAKSVWP